MSRDDWETADEVAYIQGLGTWIPERPARDRKVPLSAYLRAMPGRKDWGLVDAWTCRETARTELAKEILGVGE